jgi:hypothetical protein
MKRSRRAFAHQSERRIIMGLLQEATTEPRKGPTD